MKEEKQELARLLDIITKVAAGHYSDDIMALTVDTISEPIRSIAEAMAMMMVKVEAREYQLEQMVGELRQLNEKIRRNALQTVLAMVQALEARDTYTRGHAERVASIATEIATELGLEEKRIELIHTAGLLHDIGKIGFSDRIFQNHGTKNPPDVVKEIVNHPKMGADILQPLDFLDCVTKIILAHHERLDGAGYPYRLTADKISLEARIIAVADGFDAMTTDRPYQKAMSPDTALDILKKSAGMKLDADCVAALVQIQTRKKHSIST